MKKSFLTLLFSFLYLMSLAQKKQIELTFMHTSDVHANIFSHENNSGQRTDYGLPHLAAIADSLRAELGEQFILTDGGDCLQGQPVAYYYNYVDTQSTHLVASAMNRMNYVCAVMGNHDIETGHPVYDHWVEQLRMPVLGANVVDVRTGEPYLTPYIIILRAGVRVALLGMVTPTIPLWLPEHLWQGLRFDDIVTSSRYWIDRISREEHPDVIVGLFHSGFSSGMQLDGKQENAVEQTAREVAGFDLILFGHDHRTRTATIPTPDGREVVCVGPSSDGRNFVLARMLLTLEDGRVTSRQVTAQTPSTADFPHDDLAVQFFEADFVEERLAVNHWVSRVLGHLLCPLDETDAFFGSSAFIDLIHTVQLQATGADISFTAPLSTTAKLKAGPLTVSDMFRLYKFENLLCTMQLTGNEIHSYLEMSYSQWTNQMTRADDPLILYGPNNYYASGIGFTNLPYNMDSAAGIRYEVDVRQPAGERVHILSMADGTPFSPDSTYRVAVNSYRAGGGGSLLTKGAGIPREQLASRILTTSDTDLRSLLMDYISSHSPIYPQPLHHWRFVPEEWTSPAAERDRKILFR